MKMMKHAAAALALALVVAGCASGGKGPSDAELIDAAVGDFIAGMQTQDVEKIMSVVSDNFRNPEASSKAALGDFLGNAIAAGYLEQVEIGTEEATQSRDDGTEEVYVYPLEVESLAGVATIGLTLKKEEGAWLITGMDLEM